MKLVERIFEYTIWQHIDTDDMQFGLIKSKGTIDAIFYVRQRSYSAYMPWQFRLSVCPSVTRVDQSKTVEARIMQFSPYSSPIPLVFRG